MFTDNYSMICIIHLWLFHLLTDRCATAFGVGLTLANFCCWLRIIYTQIGLTPPRFLDSLAEDSSLLGHEAVSLSKWVLMFWGQYDPPKCLLTICPNRQMTRIFYLTLFMSRSHYRLNQFLCNITILSRGMIQCFSCLNCWIAAIDRCHHIESIRCMLLPSSPVTYHAMPHTSNVAQ